MDNDVAVRRALRGKLVSMPIQLTIRRARGQHEQQRAIVDWLRDTPGSGRSAIIAEAALHELRVPGGVRVERLAAGCVCCVGLLPMRVTLLRVLRIVQPDALLLLIADDSHLDRVRSMIAGFGLGTQLA
jgi:hypothetical protein